MKIGIAIKSKPIQKGIKYNVLISGLFIMLALAILLNPIIWNTNEQITL